MRIFCEQKTVLFYFTWKSLDHSDLDHLVPPCAADPISRCVTLQSSTVTREGVREVGVSAGKCREAVKAAVVGAAPPHPQHQGPAAAHPGRGQWWCCWRCPPRCWPCRCNPPRPAAERAPGAGCRRCARSRTDWEPAARGDTEPVTGETLPDNVHSGMLYLTLSHC